ncbi:GLTP domain-containing protein [Meloidogyne graminicola]|uniref:GLTP domain-containing protein n=1 Tax=Meloidogyne graminicola TaxID=189291 RepID=A0A8S9ZUV5_9BILA|nr:GLTP domain-containing protein [Meloidogyne graminicola]
MENIENGNETYFSHKERIFPKLQDGKIPTEQFLLACQGIADFVGFLGTAFIPVKNDISGNVRKVENKFETDRQKLYFLQDLIDADIHESNGKIGLATEGLLWLKRGLEFMLSMLKQLVKDYKNGISNGNLSKSENITNILRNAYETTLKRHHNFISKQLFKVVIHAAPSRKTLLKALAFGNENLERECINHIEELLGNFGANVQSLVAYYNLKGLEHN